MNIVVGSYDSVVAGYCLTKNPNPTVDNSVIFQQRFSDASHKGCIKSVTLSNKGVLASGSTDETIHLFDLERGTDVGHLVSHEGDITCLRFAGKDFLYSGSSDGTIRMWRTRIWELQRAFKGHKGGVLSFDIHPSKKLALSVGADKKLIVWDLVAGKYSFIRNMRKLCNTVKFNKSGSSYAITNGSTIDIFSLATAKIISSQKLPSHIGNFTFASDDLIAVATDSGKIYVISSAQKKVLLEFEAHSNRVRDVEAVPSSDENNVLLLSCSSDQTLKAWKLTLNEMSHKLLGTVNTGCRITCLTATHSTSAVDILLTEEPFITTQNEAIEKIQPSTISDKKSGLSKKKKSEKKAKRLNEKPKSVAKVVKLK